MVENLESGFGQQYIGQQQLSNIYESAPMSFFLSYFRALISKDCDITIELKNGVTVTGKIKYIDNNMCIFLEQISIKDKEEYPQLSTLSSIFVRGSAIKYIHPPYDQAQLILVSEAVKAQ